MKREKQLFLDEIQEQITGVESFVITQYANLSAKKANEFRREIAKVGGNFEVVPKRVFLKAAAATGIKFDISALPGHIGVVFVGNDPIEATKTIVQFNAKHEQIFTLLAARVEGQQIHAEDVNRLSKLPGKEQMRAEILGLFEAPMAQTLACIEALLSSVIYCLDNKSKGADSTAPEA